MFGSSDIGRWLPGSVRLPFLTVGVIVASFQPAGTRWSTIDRLKSMDRGVANNSGQCFRIRAGRPSGPGEVNILSRLSLAQTISSEMVVVVSDPSEKQQSNPEMHQWDMLCAKCLVRACAASQLVGVKPCSVSMPGMPKRVEE